MKPKDTFLFKSYLFKLMYTYVALDKQKLTLTYNIMVTRGWMVWWH